MGETEWTLWSEQRPTDTSALYRWRVPARKICGMMLRPEWSGRLHLCGMGFADSEWWPMFSRWDGYQRSVADGLEWRPARDGEGEDNIVWGGLDLLPCPHTGAAPVVEYHGRWLHAPPYEVEWLYLKAWLVKSAGWKSAAEMRDAWNRRALSAPVQGVPEGWKLVPIKATQEMLIAFLDHALKDNIGGLEVDDPEAGWSDALSAAPEPPAPVSEGWAAIVRGFLACPEIADCAPEDLDPETRNLERRARQLTDGGPVAAPSVDAREIRAVLNEVSKHLSHAAECEGDEYVSAAFRRTERRVDRLIAALDAAPAATPSVEE